MSFSSEVKEELAGLNSQARHCRIALIAALFHLCPYLTQNRAGIRTESGAAAAAFENALRRVMDYPVEKHRQGREITVWIEGSEAVRVFLETVKLDRTIRREDLDRADGKDLVRQARISPNLLQKTCCRRAFLRGIFLAAGSVSDPSKSYHLEIAPLSDEDAARVQELLHAMGFGAKCTMRKGKRVVYLKEGEQISDFLGAAGATKSLMNLENARILRNIAGNINRQVNFETANLIKTGIASGRQLEDIALIDRTVGIGSLPRTLQEAARLRMEYPDRSLQELAQSCEPPVGRSGMNHRLKRLSEIALRLRENGIGKEG